MSRIQGIVMAIVLLGSFTARAGARTMGVIFVDLANEPADPVREKLIADMISQGCWARDDCGGGIGLRVDLPKGLTKEDLVGAVSGREPARLKVAKIANSEVDHEWKHPDGYFWDFDGFLVYSIDKAKGQFTITALDEDARAIGSVTGDGMALAKKKWERRTLLKQALAPLWKRFSP
jgi:hypothetical protein